MDSIDTIFNYYLTELPAGSGDALARLLDMPPNILPMVVAAYSTEQDPGVRANLVRVAWEQRSADALPILETALDDPVPAVLKEALDGLVTLGSPEARRVLVSASDVRPERETNGSYTFNGWLQTILTLTRERTT